MWTPSFDAQGHAAQVLPLRRRGKPACVIVGAVGNRWLRTLHHAMKAATTTTGAIIYAVLGDVHFGTAALVDYQSSGAFGYQSHGTPALAM